LLAKCTSTAGDWQHAEAVKEALIGAGEPFGLVLVGALAYATPSVESGWIPSPVPGIYSDPDLMEYRRHIALYGVEGQRPLGGSYFSENIEDYYCSPYELGYGKMISFNHDFIGRGALQKAKNHVPRRKVTLVFDTEDVRKFLGNDPGFVLSYSRHRVESGSGLVGMTFQTAGLDPVGTLLSLTLLDKQYAEPGTEVSVVWGEHPGPGTAPDAELGFPRIRPARPLQPARAHAVPTQRLSLAHRDRPSGLRRRFGLVPVPHISVRRLPSQAALEEPLAALRADGTTDNVFIGDPAQAPRGP